MQITAIKRQKGSPNRVKVFAGDVQLVIAAEVALRAGLRVGDVLGAADVEALETADLTWRCKEMALVLLSHRPRSERELRQRLLARKLPPSIVDACIASLSRARLLDDEAFALAFARERLRGRPAGRARLLRELRAKGLDADRANQALDKAFHEGELAEMDLARRAVGKFKTRPGEDPARVQRRLYGYLARRGFTGDTISELIDEILASE